MESVSDPRIYSGRYQVTHLIARGGMAIVYRAQDQLLNRPVALKILYPELSADPLFVERISRTPTLFRCLTGARTMAPISS
jgi:serine/threonine protein kinase